MADRGSFLDDGSSRKSLRLDRSGGVGDKVRSRTRHRVVAEPAPRRRHHLLTLSATPAIPEVGRNEKMTKRLSACALVAIMTLTVLAGTATATGPSLSAGSASRLSSREVSDKWLRAWRRYDRETMRNLSTRRRPIRRAFKYMRDHDAPLRHAGGDPPSSFHYLYGSPAYASAIVFLKRVDGGWRVHFFGFSSD